jgi:hypothetical protein
MGHILRTLDGSRDLVVALAEGRIPDVVLHVVDDALSTADNRQLERLRASLDQLAGKRR